MLRGVGVREEGEVLGVGGGDGGLPGGEGQGQRGERDGELHCCFALGFFLSFFVVGDEILEGYVGSGARGV